MAERRADLQGNEDVEALVSNASDGWSSDLREELGEGERLGGVAAESGRLLGVQVWEGGFVEAEVGPGYHEAVECQQEVGEAVDWENGEYGDGDEVEKREARDTKRDYAAEEGDGVAWDELGESYEEANLGSGSAANGC